jgi:HAD superfamily hydrolase (TIGR01509 family)
MDGVLIDSESKYAIAIDNMLAERNIKVTREQRLSFIGASPQKIGTWLREWYPGFPYTVDQFRDIYIDTLIFGVKQVSSLIDGLDRWIPALRSKGIKTAVASSGPKIIVDEVMTRYGLWDRMDAILSAADILEAKPAPEIFLKAASLVGVPPDKCLVIEDSQNGITAAKAAGMTCAAFTGAPRIFDSVHGEDLTIENYDDPTFVSLFGEFI